MSALVWSEILTLFVNMLTAHNKYSLKGLKGRASEDHAVY